MPHRAIAQRELDGPAATLVGVERDGHGERIVGPEGYADEAQRAGRSWRLRRRVAVLVQQLDELSAVAASQQFACAHGIADGAHSASEVLLAALVRAEHEDTRAVQAAASTRGGSESEL